MQKKKCNHRTPTITPLSHLLHEHTAHRPSLPHSLSPAKATLSNTFPLLLNQLGESMCWEGVFLKDPHLILLKSVVW